MDITIMGCGAGAGQSGAAGSSKMGRRPLYTVKQRDKVLALRNAGMTIRAIADETGVNKTSVHRICKQYGAA